ncbi:MAG: RNA methyltransferase [Mycoplasmataceae bacterium]|jgi:TrmH family RNA methyltransferase|nr:RNA methyltransferase [Mycoplasmataceae bacterium]
MELIKSKSNKLIKSITKLISDKKYRDETFCFVAETCKVVNDLIASGIKCRNLIIAHTSKYLSKFQGLKDIDISVVDDDVFKSFSSLATSDGVCGIFIKVKTKFVYSQEGKYVVLDRIQNPGNLGTIIRTCVCFGITGIVITNDSVDIYNPTTIRSSMGSCFAIPILVSTSLSDEIKKMQSNKIKVYATMLSKEAKKLNDVVFDKGTAVIFGNEGKGLEPSEIKAVDESIYIPITNKTDSLNVSIAAGIIISRM